MSHIYIMVWSKGGGCGHLIYGAGRLLPEAYMKPPALMTLSNVPLHARRSASDQNQWQGDVHITVPDSGK